MSGDLPTFDPVGPLPSGTIVLEASAGTGKTWTIAALAARYLAEGVVGLDQLMMITFSRQATQELRNRIRGRLVATEAALSARLADPAASLPDPVDRLLAATTPEELRARRDRIARALTELDAATIATTHEFCQRMLAGLGVLVDHGRDDVLVEDLSDLAREVAADFYLRAYADADRPAFGWAEARDIAARVVEYADAAIAPDDDSPRSRFARGVRAEVERRKRRLGRYTFHDQQQRLADALRDEPAARERLAAQFPVVLVDEFQDTDPVQWEILATAFDGASTLVLIGDPKQAIYGFRGADVNSYLRAVRQTGAVATLGTNWRSDARLVDGLGQLSAGAELGHPDIAVREVAAAHTAPRLAVTEPLRLRVLPAGERRPRVGTLQTAIVADLTRQVTALLADPPTLADQPPPGAAGPGPENAGRPLAASDIAVLTQTHRVADTVTEALARAGVPVVRVGAGSVYRSPEARDWLVLLEALAQPRPARIRRAALTVFGGWTLAELAGADEARLAEWTARIRGWRRVLAGHGVAALVEALGEAGLAERLLGVRGGERRLTDLRQIGQDLHAAQRARQLGVAGLIEWLGEQLADADQRSEKRARRLDTDAHAVQVMTVHAAKGLEFPVVLLPDLWRSASPPVRGPQVRYDESGRRVLDVVPRTGPHPGRADEDRADALRKAYVALTRASRMIIAWWAWHDRVSPEAPLHRLLQRTGPVPPDRARPGVDPGTAPGFAVSELVPDEAGDPPQLTRPPIPGRLFARVFDRELDLTWRRTSYSGLTARAHDAAHPEPASPALALGGAADSEPAAREDDEPGADGEALPTRTGPQLADADLALPSPMAGLVSGTAFGTLVHEILERVDTTAPDLSAAVLAAAREQLTRLPLAGVGAEELAAALQPVLATPLGPLAGDRTLADFAPADRLAELDFEYPLGGGDRPGASGVVGDIAALLRRHLPADDPLAPYPDLLDAPLVAEESLRGWLTGSIDAVLRATDAGTPRHFVVDYKTNWLGSAPGEPLTVGHYAPQAMAGAMMAAHYPLQALLYCVALHRFLRWRLADYRPDDHLGGVLYLFVRGMAGPATPVIDGTPCGVFAWHPPAELIMELSELLHGRRP